MNIDEAIKIKEEGQHWLPKESFPELIEADNLSIEALKRVRDHTRIHASGESPLLPGETKD